MSKQRNVVIDIMKGITIYLVILGHFENIPEIRHWIFSFHMPLFFFLSGYYHKPEISWQTVAKDARRLIVPFLFVMVILTIYSFTINILFRYTPEQLLKTVKACIFPTGANGANNVPIWFLFALFWTRSFFNITCIRIIPPHLQIVIPLTIGLFFVYVYDDIPFEMPFALMAGITALPFFTVGYLWRAKRVKERIGIIWPITLIGIWLLFYRYCDGVMICCQYSNYPLYFICSIGGILGIYYLSKGISRVKYISSFLAWSGVHSLIILCAHTIERYVAIPWEELIDLTNTWFVLTIKILLCSILVVVSYHLRFTRFVFKLDSKA